MNQLALSGLKFRKNNDPSQFFPCELMRKILDCQDYYIKDLYTDTAHEWIIGYDFRIYFTALPILEDVYDSPT